MKYVVKADEKPPIDNMPGYIVDFERGLDPWHRDAFGEEFNDAAPNQKGPRASGWFALDAWGNPVTFVADGDEIELPEMKSSG